MLASVAINIEAPAALVFRLARPVDRWEVLLPHYVRSRVVERRADGSLLASFVARRPLIGVVGLGMPVAWRARAWNEPDSLRLRFVHVAGPTKGMDVTWRIEPIATGCRVSIEHDFRSGVPGFAAFVDRWFTRPIAGRTLATFKALAEALADGPQLSPESDPVAVTNQWS
jgi:ribosome-associated toxin RatA of RatAB toxin-antitoxin module